MVTTRNRTLGLVRLGTSECSGWPCPARLGVRLGVTRRAEGPRRDITSNDNERLNSTMKVDEWGSESCCAVAPRAHAPRSLQSASMGRWHAQLAFRHKEERATLRGLGRCPLGGADVCTTQLSEAHWKVGWVTEVCADGEDSDQKTWQVWDPNVGEGAKLTTCSPAHEQHVRRPTKRCHAHVVRSAPRRTSNTISGAEIHGC